MGASFAGVPAESMRSLSALGALVTVVALGVGAVGMVGRWVGGCGVAGGG